MDRLLYFLLLNCFCVLFLIFVLVLRHGRLCATGNIFWERVRLKNWNMRYVWSSTIVDKNKNSCSFHLTFKWKLENNRHTHTKKTYIKSDKIYWMYMNGYHGCSFAYIMLLSCALWLHSEALIVTFTTYLRLFIFDVSSRSIAHKLDAISGSPHRIPIPRNEDNSAILYVDKNIALFFFHSTIYD